MLNANKIILLYNNIKCFIFVFLVRVFNIYMCLNSKFKIKDIICILEFLFRYKKTEKITTS